MPPMARCRCHDFPGSDLNQHIAGDRIGDAEAAAKVLKEIAAEPSRSGEERAKARINHGVEVELPDDSPTGRCAEAVTLRPIVGEFGNHVDQGCAIKEIDEPAVDAVLDDFADGSGCGRDDGA